MTKLTLKEIKARNEFKFNWKYEPKDFIDFNQLVIPGEVDSLEAIAIIANKKLQQYRETLLTQRVLTPQLLLISYHVTKEKCRQLQDIIDEKDTTQRIQTLENALSDIKSDMKLMRELTETWLR